MTTGNASNRQAQSSAESVLGDGLERVCRTGRLEPARAASEWADQELIRANGD
jgi:hypothetical protein